MNKDKTKFNEAIRKLEEQSLISTEYLKANSLLDWNITPEKIIFYIVEAQELHLERILGSKLYRKLMDKNNLTFEYQLLMDKFVAKYLIHKALASYLKVARYSVMQGSIYIHAPTDAETVEHFEISILVKNEESKAHEYERRMVEFLKKYSTTFTEWKECIGDGLKANLNPSKYIGGWNLQRTISPKEKEGISEDLWASDAGCCGTMESACAGGACPPDFDLFTVNFWYGISDTEDMASLDLTTLNEDNTIPVNVEAQPGGEYFWMVATIDFYINQMDTPVPLGAFSDTDPLSDVYVTGTHDNKVYIRIKMKDMYETAVTFGLKTQ